MSFMMMRSRMQDRSLLAALLVVTVSVGCSKPESAVTSSASTGKSSTASASATQTADSSQSDAEASDLDSAETKTSSASQSEAPSETASATQPKSKPRMSVGAFRTAALEGRLDSVRSGIEQGIDINGTDSEQSLTALHMAAYNGHTETVQYLIESGAEIDSRDSGGKTPLIHACTGPFAKSVVVLIDAGADVNAIDSVEGFTPIMMAAGLGELEVVKVLLAHDADKTILDEDKDSAADHARNSGHNDIVALLE
jgi:ankyrin repeat protein